MTKKELVALLNKLDDDAIIYIGADSLDWDGIKIASNVRYDDVVTGGDVQNEVTLIGFFLEWGRNDI